MAAGGALAWCGAVAGVVAPLTIGSYVVWAGKRRAGYDPWRDNMTKLGDDVDLPGVLFVVANAMVAVELGIVAAAFRSELALERLALGLAVAGVASLAIGLTACKCHCRWPGITGRAPRLTSTLHVGAAFVAGGLIVLAPAIAAYEVWGDERFVTLWWIGVPCTVIAAGFGALFVIESGRARKHRPARRRPVFKAGLYERLLWIVGYTWLVVAAISLVSRAWWPPVAGAVWLATALFFVGRPGWRDPSPEFDVRDCQPSTLKSIGEPNFGTMYVLRIDDAGRFLSTLQEFAEDFRPKALDGPCASAAKSVKPSSGVTIGFSARGLEQLGVPHRWNAGAVDDAFGVGMKRRAGVIGDTDASAVSKWDGGWKGDDLDVVLWIVAGTPEALTDADERTSGLRSHGATVVVEEHTSRLTDTSTEHFGFDDGVGSPWIDRVHDNDPVLHRRDRQTDRRGGGARTIQGTWRPIALGEFVLGHVDETGDIFPLPSPPDVFEGGTFMVVRKLEQDVAGFHALTARSDHVASALVGRTTDGRPLADPAVKAGAKNTFTFGEDPEGLGCPRGAHVRRANPRDALGFASTLTARRRILRRGMTYGTKYEDGETQPPVDGRGILFIAYNVRIAEQFEFVQSEWLNGGQAFGLGSDPDVIAGQWPVSSRRMVVLSDRNGPPSIRMPAPQLVRVRGGEYFFVPSYTGLAALIASARAA